jgi:putative ABC transport system permease protein
VIAVPLLLFVSITWLLSIPLGALLSWLLISKLNIMSFGWSMPMLWSFEPPMILAALSLALVSLTVFIAIWRLKRRLPTALAELGSGG